MDKKIAVVMPVANEEATIQKLLTDILKQPYRNMTVMPVMDSYSKDRTQEIIESMQKKDPRIQLLYNKNSTGVVSCYLYGFDQAIRNDADIIVEMDGGGSHDPVEIPKFVEPLEQGYDCVFSTRFRGTGGFKNHPLKRRLVSRGGTWLANAVLHTSLSDMTSGYEAFRRPVLQAIRDQVGFSNILSLQASHFIQTELRYYCAKAKSKEVPIVYTGSTSTLKNSTIYKSLLLLFELKSRKPVSF
jgi:glycosyltransferase involved in cell wall biosynthesis